MLARNLVAKWEAKLKREGLAPIDQVIGGRLVVRTQIIKPARRYVDRAEDLADALELWLRGSFVAFTAAGLELLAHQSRNHPRGPRWPRIRATRLLRICRGVVEGKSVHEACTRPGDDDLAYTYLRPLAAALVSHSAEESPQGDDGFGNDDGA